MATRCRTLEPAPLDPLTNYCGARPPRVRESAAWHARHATNRPPDPLDSFQRSAYTGRRLRLRFKRATPDRVLACSIVRAMPGIDRIQQNFRITFSGRLRVLSSTRRVRLDGTSGGASRQENLRTTARCRLQRRFIARFAANELGSSAAARALSANGFARQRKTDRWLRSRYLN